MTALQPLMDHLWQSTLVAAGIACLTWLLRRQRADIRHALWLVASVKFAIPFSALATLGRFVGSWLPVRVPQPAPERLLDVATESFLTSSPLAPVPAAAAATPTADALVPALVTLWAAGCVLLVTVWFARWVRVAATARSAVAMQSGPELASLRRVESRLGRRTPLEIRQTSATLEPGVFGLFRPVLLWPSSMSRHLSDEHIEAIFVHELAHVRRRDNLAAVIHAVIQAACWFHPMIWWIGARLIDERERACDEAVVRYGSDRHTYAESILKTCQFCTESPVTCVSGVTGADLKARIAGIMTAPLKGRVSVVVVAGLAISLAALIVVPLLGGASTASQGVERIELPDRSITFEVASIRPSDSSSAGSSFNSNNGTSTLRNMSVARILQTVWRGVETSGGPGWLETARFDIVAKGPDSPDAPVEAMLYNLLVDRFALRAHVETRNQPVYALVLARSDAQLGPNLIRSDCESFSSGPGPCGTAAPFGATPTVVRPGADLEAFQGASGSEPGGRTISGAGVSMQIVARVLARLAGRPVIDRTNLTGVFKYRLRYADPTDAGSRDAPSLFAAVEEQWGLKLEATRAPVDMLVIESAERPSNDDFTTPTEPAGRGAAFGSGPAQDARPTPAPNQRPSFEVTSIKANPTGQGTSAIAFEAGGRLVAPNVDVRHIIRTAYGIEDVQLLSAPEWTTHERFSLQAKGAADASTATVRLMLQSMLAERFGFVGHSERRELPISALVMARSDKGLGPRLHLAGPECRPIQPLPGIPQPPPPPGGRGGLRLIQPTDETNPRKCGTVLAPGWIAARSLTMKQFASVLSTLLRRPVVEETGLTQEYDFDIVFMPEGLGGVLIGRPPAAVAEAPALAVALQDELGLKLESRRGPVDVLVVDRIARPTNDDFTVPAQ